MNTENIISDDGWVFIKNSNFSWIISMLHLEKDDIYEERVGVFQVYYGLGFSIYRFQEVISRVELFLRKKDMMKAKRMCTDYSVTFYNTNKAIITI